MRTIRFIPSCDGAARPVAGADVKFFVDKIRADAIPDIYDFTAEGHDLLNMVESSSKTTVALTGLALGGGLELALACDYRIGTRRTQFRFRDIDRHLPWFGRLSTARQNMQHPRSSLGRACGQLHERSNRNGLGPGHAFADVAGVDACIVALASAQTRPEVSR